MADNNFLAWDAEITKDAPERVTLPAGKYQFMVQELEKGVYTGTSEKIGNGCPMATLKIVVYGGELGNSFVTDRLYLSDKMEWKLGTFFRCIGQKKHGERLVMDWNKVVGSQGRARFKVRNYTNRDGEQRQTNDLDRFYDYDPAFFPKKQTPAWVAEAERAPAQTWEQSGF